MFRFFMPTEVFFGRDCVAGNGARLKELGTHALIVTGKSSASNGSLADVLLALRENGQRATVYDAILPNPTVAQVRGGISLLKSVGADFVIGLGGGSPMDAAKAIALLSMEDRADEEIFSGGYGTHALPMAHIPTTAGTGSEVTPYAILTNDALRTKTSVFSPALFPRFAFLDGKYMERLSPRTSVNTALDAFSHAAESLLSKNSSPSSEMFAREALSRMARILPHAAGFSLGERDEMLYCSALAGMAIAQTGTTAVHGMGYSLTYFYGIDHGRANGLLLGQTFRLCEKKKIPAMKTIERSCGMSTEELCRLLDGLLGERERIPREELLGFAAVAAKGKNIPKSSYEPTERELAGIFLHSLATP